MHGGPLKPSVHLFSFGAWCKGNERTRVRGLTCTKPAPAPEEKWPGPWCKGNGGTRVSGLSCTKSAPAPEKKSPGTWCKGNEETSVRGLSCTKPAPVPTGGPRLGQRPHRLRPATPSPSTGGLPQRRPPLTPQPVVKSTHMSTFVFSRIIIKFME